MFLRHAAALALRLFLLAAALWLFVADRGALDFTAPPRLLSGGWFPFAVWLLLAAGMLFRLFPNRRAAMGARKHFACSYRPAAAVPLPPDAARQLHRGAGASAFFWILFNAAVFLALFLSGLLLPAAALVLVLVYAVCDMVCILFFCPFQVFFLRNRCCTVCRIYNWDCFMMCTPLLAFPCLYSISLLLLSLAVLLRWETALRRRPHYFSDKTNENLRCPNCEDKLCLLRGVKAYGNRE